MSEHEGGGQPYGPRSGRVRSVRRLHRRASREEARRFLAEGPQAVREALAAPRPPELFVTSDAAQRHSDLVEEAVRRGVAVHRVTAAALAALATTVTPQGIVAVCPFLDVDLATALTPRTKLVAVLGSVRDPGNAGTVLRAADAAGAAAVVLGEASVDAYNPKVVRASAGSLFHLPVVNKAAIAATVEAAHAAGLRVLAADPAATDTLDAAADRGDLARPTAWLFGNEAWGFAADSLADVDGTVRVPIHGRAESLNLAVAAALCLYASARAQRNPPPVVRQERVS